MTTAAERYHEVAASLIERALSEQDQSLRAEWRYLALSYLRLAEQAERNGHFNVVYGALTRGMTKPTP